MIELTALQLSEYIKKEKDLTLIDVREEWEYKTAAIQNSIHIPISQIQEKMAEFEHNQQIVFICHHGIRSRMVCNFFERMNYKNVINLLGGIDSWSKNVDNNVPTY